MVRRHTDYAPVKVRVTVTRRREIVHLHSPGSGACRVVTDVVALLFPPCGGVRREQALARLGTRRIPFRGALSKIARIRHTLHGRPHTHATNSTHTHICTPTTFAHTKRRKIARPTQAHSLKRRPPLQPRPRHARRRSPAARQPLRCPWRCAIVSRAPRLQAASSDCH
jgi:hypothetical protein